VGVGLGAGVYLAILLLMKHEFTLDLLKKANK
jgi:hypothetical protein